MLIENFIREKKSHPDFGKSMRLLEEELYNYTFKVFFYSYIKKTIVFSASRIKKKIADINNNEDMTLNTIHPSFKEEKINLVIDEEIDFLENIHMASNLREISIDSDIVRAIDTLTSKQKEIIYYCILLNISDSNVAKKLGITKQAVNKAKKNALCKLRSHIINDSCE